MTTGEDLFLDSLLNVHISTAAKYDQSVQEAPASVSVISSDDIRRYGYRTVSEALMSVPGFYTSYDRNYTYIGVRGFSRPTDFNDRILLLLDGHVLNESYYGSTYFDKELAINMASIECIEVVRGPGSVLYGAGAVFAVINIITKKGNRIDGADVAIEGGSVKRYDAAVMIGKRINNDLEYSVSGTLGDSRGEDIFYPEYFNPPSTYGISKNLDWEKYYGCQYTVTYKTVTLGGMLSSRRKGIPTASYSMMFNDSRAQSLDNYFFTEIKFQEDVSNNKNVTFRGYLDSYKYEGIYPMDIMNTDNTHTLSVGSELRLRWDVTSGNRVIAGSEYRNNAMAKYQSSYNYTTYYDKDFPYWNISLYLQDEIQLIDNLVFTLGVRHDHYSTVGNAINPRASLVYFPFTSSTLKFLYGEAYRAPNIYEMHYEDPALPQVANPKLSLENIKTIELEWEQKISRQFMSTLSLFHSNMYNLIDLVGDSVLQFNNIVHVKSMGVESSLLFTFNPEVRAYLNYSFQYTRDITNDDKLTNSPTHLAQCGLGFPVLTDVMAGVECRYESKRITVYQTSTNPFFIANLNLSIETPSGRLRGSFKVSNVFNTSYQTPGRIEHLQPAITQDGRTYTVRLAYSL